jgi:hypothetical protein
LACGVRRAASGQSHIFKFHAKGGKRATIHSLIQQRRAIRKVIEQANHQGLPIVTADFKANMELFELPAQPTLYYNAHDLGWGGSTYAGADFADIERHIDNGLKRMAATKLRDWHRILADAAPVYQSLQERGVLIGGILERPRWSQQTFSGRSKALGIGIQGLDNTWPVGNPLGTERDMFVHFDWIAADINVAARLSGDADLQATFASSDPYTHLRDLLQMERGECKLALLTAINRLDVTSPIVTDVFPDLGRWLISAKEALAANGRLATVLGRNFSLRYARNDLAVLNGVLQGSVAHAMQLAVRRVWERFTASLLVEVHDSLILTCYPMRPMLQNLIHEVAGIMTRPFAGLDLNGLCAGDDFFFPTKVSVGSKYKRWRSLYIFREDGVQYVAEQAPEGIEAPQEKGGEVCQA